MHALDARGLLIGMVEYVRVIAMPYEPLVCVSVSVCVCAFEGVKSVCVHVFAMPHV